MDNLEEELIELEAEKGELVADSKEAKEAVAAKNLDNVPAAAKVVGLASKKSVATDVKSLPNTGIDSAAMASLAGVGLLLTLGTVKTKRRK